MKRPPSRWRQHALLLALFLAAATLANAYAKRRLVEPRLDALRREEAEEHRRLQHIDALLQTREAMDLGEMQRAVAEARERLRRVELAEKKEGPTFLDATSLPAVASFQGLVSRRAVESELVVQRHAAVTEQNPGYEGLVVRDLELRGRFPQLVAFVDSLGQLPHRIAILSFDLRIDPVHPGQLRALLRYSL